MKAFVLLFLATACSAAPVVSRSAPAAIGPLPISCNGGRELVYSHKLANGNAYTVEMRCTDERVTVSRSLTQPVPPDTDMSPVVSQSGPVEIDRATFERIWRGVIGGRCNRANATRSSMTIRNLADKRSVTCADDDAWAALLEPVEGPIPAIPSPSEVDAERFKWPFGGQYWKDELHYYSGKTSGT